MNFLLASDMDGTVIPLDDCSQTRQDIAEFKQRVDSHPSLTLAYVTGRHLELARAGVEQWNLPTPDAMVCDVGTTVYWRQGDRYESDPRYAAVMNEQMGGFTGVDVQAELSTQTELTLQEPECQSEFKTSYYAPHDCDQGALVATLEAVLTAKGIRVNIIYSIDPHKHVGLVDVLPATIAKDFALAYLHRTCGCDKDHVVYAGDSGNDLKAFISGYRAIAVANTPDWVKDELQDNPQSRVYVSKANSAGGVVEGCRHWGLFG